VNVVVADMPGEEVVRSPMFYSRLMDIILLAGLWLPQRIWAATIAELESLGHNPIPVALPGVDDSSTVATLDDQIAAVLVAVDAADRPIVVGHSAACSLAWLAADRRPDDISRVILIGGFPASDGDAYADFFESSDGVMGFPGWTPFEGADSADLDEAAREGISSDAIPVPVGVSKGIVRLSDERRMSVPVSVVCPEFTPDQARAWIDAGDVLELENAKSVSFVNIDSGHWPMVTQPVELARILDVAARGA
jgi:pimeloyl-ACP methyl ester carboxylesterase